MSALITLSIYRIVYSDVFHLEEVAPLCHTTVGVPAWLPTTLLLYYVVALVVPLALFKYAERTSEKMRRRFLSCQYQQTLAARVALKRSVEINHTLFRVASFQV